MPVKGDLRRASACRKWGLSEAGGQVQTCPLDSMLESAELSALWHEIGFRVEQAGGVWPMAQARLLPPQALANWQSLTDKADPEFLSFEQELRTPLLSLSSLGMPGFLLAPVHGGAVLHWTSLVFHWQPSVKKFTAEYKDSLAEPLQSQRDRASQVFLHARRLLGADFFTQTELPPTADSAKQLNGVDCGFFVLQVADELVRQYRGEGVTRTQPVTKALRTQANAWLLQLADIRKKEVAAEKAAEAVKAKTLLKTAKAASSTATDAASTTTAEADSTATAD